MKKFGTPILAAPGSASVYEGSGCAALDEPVSGVSPPPVSALGCSFFGAASTLPVSDSVLESSLEALLPASSPVFLSVFFLGLSAFFLPSSLVLPVPPFWFSGVAVAVGVAVDVAVIVGACVAVGVGVVSVEPRSTIDDTAAGRPGIWI